MNLSLKHYQFIEKALCISVLILVFQFCLPHYNVGIAQAQETKTSTNLGPVLVKISPEQSTINTLPNLADKQPKMVRWVTVTAYSSTVDQCDETPFITANGKHVYDGLVATNFLYFGTHVKFPDYFGDKIFTVDDRMNAKYQTRMDVWMPTREQAKQFGVRYLKVEIY